MRVLRHSGRNRSKPFSVFRCCVRPHDAANVALAVEHIVVVVAPVAARAAFIGLTSRYVPWLIGSRDAAASRLFIIRSKCVHWIDPVAAPDRIAHASAGARSPGKSVSITWAQATSSGVRRLCLDSLPSILSQYSHIVAPLRFVFWQLWPFVPFPSILEIDPLNPCGKCRGKVRPGG